MSPKTRVFPILFASCLLTACSTFAVRSPVCEPPPIPVENLQPCPDPELPTEATFGSLYLNSLKNTGPWGQCMRMHQQLIALVKYRDSICPAILAQNQSQSNKSWWQFWK